VSTQVELNTTAGNKSVFSMNKQ